MLSRSHAKQLDAPTRPWQVHTCLIELGAEIDDRRIGCSVSSPAESHSSCCSNISCGHVYVVRFRNRFFVVIFVVIFVVVLWSCLWFFVGIIAGSFGALCLWLVLWPFGGLRCGFVVVLLKVKKYLSKYTTTTNPITY